MKKMRKLLVFVLVVSMILSLTACSKKAIDADKFEEIMEDKFDFDVDEGYTADEMDERLISVGKDGNYVVTYVLYKDAEDASDEIDKEVEYYENNKNNDDVEDSIKVSGSGSYKMFVLKSEREDGGGMYMVMIRSGKMLITAKTCVIEEKGVKKIKRIIKELGY